MKITRRNALLVGTAGVASLMCGSLLTRRVDDEIFRILRNNFGDRIADAPDTKIFVSDVAKLWSDLNTDKNRIIQPTVWRLEFISSTARENRASFEEGVVKLFLRSTNAVRSYETGTEELQYLAISDPYEAPCSNPLSAAWL